MTLHLTYTYLWVTLGIVWILGVWMGNAFLSYGETKWWEHVLIWLWPITLPLLFLARLVYTIFWSA